MAFEPARVGAATVVAALAWLGVPAAGAQAPVAPLPPPPPPGPPPAPSFPAPPTTAMPARASSATTVWTPQATAADDDEAGEAASSEREPAGSGPVGGVRVWPEGKAALPTSTSTPRAAAVSYRTEVVHRGGIAGWALGLGGASLAINAVALGAFLDRRLRPANARLP